MKTQAHKKALKMADTINSLAGMIDDYVSQLAVTASDEEAEETLLIAIGMIDDKVSKLRQQLRESFEMTQRSHCA